MRDNGPPPKRAHVAESRDLGATWTIARDHPDLVESGAGLEVLKLESGRWIVVHNDIPDGRYRLAVSVSENEGRTFERRRYIEREEKDVGRYHYPSVIQARDGPRPRDIQLPRRRRAGRRRPGQEHQARELR